MVDYLLEGIEFSDITVLDAATGAGNTTMKLARKMAEIDSRGKIISIDIDPQTSAWREIYPEELEFAAKLAGFTDIEWRRFEGGPLRKVTMEEWSEVMPPLVNKIEDEETRKAFLAMIPKIYRKFEDQGGNYPPSFIMRMRKKRITND